VIPCPSVTAGQVRSFPGSGTGCTHDRSVRSDKPWLRAIAGSGTLSCKNGRMIRYRRSASSAVESGMREGKQKFIFELAGSDGAAPAGEMAIKRGRSDAEPTGDLFDGDFGVA
jgi:hypothetical protein